MITANAIQAEARDQGLSYTQNKSSLASSGSLLGKSMGNALVKYAQAEQSNFLEQKKLDAAARQGQAKGINTVDAEAERTGWKKAIFGQDEGYEVATARAAENSIRDTYLEEATTIDNYAGITPQEYQARMASKLTEMLEKNPNDKLYRQTVTDAWTQRVEKLTAKQYEANTAYNQLTARANADRQIRQELDEVQVDLQDARTPEALAELRFKMEDIVKGDNLPSTMHPVAKRKAVNDAIFSSIAQGNIGVYNIMKQMGYDKELSGDERAQLDSALGSYNQDWSYDIATKFEEADLAATNAGTNLEVAKQTWYKLDDELNALKLRSSDTPQAKATLAKYFSASANKRSMLEDLQQRLATQGVKVDKEAEKLAAVREALRTPLIIRAGALSEISRNIGTVSKKDEAEAFDMNLLDDVKRMVGGDEDFDSIQMTAAIMTDPKLARSVGQTYRNSHVESPAIKRMFENILGGYAAEEFMDPNSKRATPALVTALSSLRAITQDNSRMPLASEQIAEFNLIDRGITAGKSIPTIQEEVKNFKENRGKVEGWALQWPGLEKQDIPSKTAYVSNLVTKAGGGTPSGATLANYMTIFKDGLQVHGGDFEGAKDYLEDAVKGQTLTYRDKPIPNGKKLNDITGKISFEQTMEWLQRSKSANGETQFQSYIKRHIQPEMRDGKPYWPSNLSEVNSWRMKVEDGFDGVYIYINNTTTPWPVRKEQLELWAETAADDEAEQAKIDEAANKAVRDMVQQRASRPF
jgi:hypothetical protein